MAYHLKSGEPVPEAMRRVVEEEIAWAIDQLSGKGDANRDVAIHEARKSIKKIRGVLRLMRPEIDPVFAFENVRFRNLGRRLSVFRDAGAVIETFDALILKYQPELRKRRLLSVRRGLVMRKQQSEIVDGVQLVMAGAIRTLRAARRRVPQWPLVHDGFAAVAPGLESTFRRGQKAFQLCRKDPTPENYHEWRKRVKDHWYHIRLLENLWTDMMQAYERTLKELETWLGEDHNLVVLREKVLSEPGYYGGRNNLKWFREFVAEYQHELRANSLSLAARIYQEKPRQFTRRMQHFWDAWRKQPKHFAEAVKQQQAGTAA